MPIAFEPLERRIQWSAAPAAFAAQGLIPTGPIVAPSDIDAAFGTGGLVTIDAFDQDSAESVVVQSDGKIVVAGWSGPKGAASDFNIDDLSANSITMVRLKPDGSLDSTFGAGGIANFPLAPNLGQHDQSLPLLLLGDGSFLVGGTGVRKISSTGTLVSSFGTAGVGGQADRKVLGLGVTPAGKIVAMGDKFDFQQLNSDGSPDDTFGTGGSVTLSVQLDESRQLAIQPDGKILAVGEKEIGTEFAWQYIITRINTDGTSDTSFGNGGFVYTGTLEQDLSGFSIAVTPDGRILVAGAGANGISLARYFADGSLDTSFGNGGLVTSDPQGGSIAYQIAFDSDGKFITASDGAGLALFRYNSDGTRDVTFADGGTADTRVVAPYSENIAEGARGLAIQPDGKVVVVGQVELDNVSYPRIPEAQAHSDFFIARIDAGSAGPAAPATSMQNPIPRPDAQLDSRGTLIVTTAAGDDHITIDLSGPNVRLNRNGTITTYPMVSVNKLDIQSGDGNDTIIASVDIPEIINSGAGNDSIVTGDGTDTIDAGDGNNTVSSGRGSDSVIAGDGNDSINGGDGENVIDAGAGNNFVQLDAGSVRTQGGDDTIIGGGGDDFGGVSITSGGGNDSITTGDGDDVINCGEGDDTVNSGGGDDQITSGGDADSGEGAVIDAGAGNDGILSLFARSIMGGEGNDRIGAYAALRVDGGAGDDVIRVGSSSDHPALVFGGDGNDSIFTGDGDDTIYGEAGRDTVHAGAGNDRVAGGSGKDLLFGQDGNDRLFGGGGNDRLEGQGGDDRLVGGGGADIINGGNGTDAATHDDSSDLITDVENDLA
jgi:uncharacterized delta-60 repeat protein